MLCIQDKENHSKCEEVRDMALIGLFVEDLGSHVGSCPDERSAVSVLLSALNFGSKTKVDDLGVVVLVEEDVFGLQVTVADAV